MGNVPSFQTILTPWLSEMSTWAGVVSLRAIRRLYLLAERSIKRRKLSKRLRPRGKLVVGEFELPSQTVGKYKVTFRY